ncbi:MAG: pseudouridine synthase [Oscillospiraceae bacterium]|nr:pseudouridine synthase [Oscillospiraceae bacterium]
MQRLDQFLSEAGAAPRKEARKLVRAGRITINGQGAVTADRKIDPQADRVCLDGAPVAASRMTTLLLYKPAGYVTSTDDPRDKTVMELIPEPYRRQGVVPAGRLDKETEGLLLLTNDGALNHRITAPRHGVRKRYYAEHTGQAGEADVAAFRDGLTLRDGTVCLPALLHPLGPGQSEIEVREGKYHQVRRMMASRGLTVTYLRREKEGELTLDGLTPGRFRELTEAENKALW